MATVPIVLLLFALAGCKGTSQSTSSASDGFNGSDQVAVPWSMDVDCTACHTVMDPNGDGAGTLSAAHVANDVTCTTCHTDVAGLTKAHENATADSKMPTRLKTTTVDTQAVCLSCHNQADLAAATANSKVLTDVNGLTINPHDLPTTGTHTTDITCTDCHIVHAQTTDIGKNAMAECVSCHHKQVFECGTCHDV